MQSPPIESAKLPAGPQLAEAFPVSLEEFLRDPDVVQNIGGHLDAIVAADRVTHFERLFLQILLKRANTLLTSIGEDSPDYSTYVKSVLSRTAVGLRKPTSDQPSGCISFLASPFVALHNVLKQLDEE
jgi:hypothetical protein